MRKKIRDMNEVWKLSMPRIKEFRMQGISYRVITEMLASEFPELTESFVSKWGSKAGLPLINQFTKVDGELKLDPKKTFKHLRIDMVLAERFEHARLRLQQDLRKKFPPNDAQVIEDLLNKT